jgi:hypothetical protein
MGQERGGDQNRYRELQHADPDGRQFSEYRAQHGADGFGMIRGPQLHVLVRFRPLRMDFLADHGPVFDVLARFRQHDRAALEPRTHLGGGLEDGPDEQPARHQHDREAEHHEQRDGQFPASAEHVLQFEEGLVD